MSASWVIAFVALWIVVLLTAAVTVGLLRRMGNVLEQVEARLASGAQDPAAWGAPVASYIPEFRVVAPNGAAEKTDEMSSAELIKVPTILLFMDANCGPCRELAKDLDGGIDAIDGVPFRVVLDAELSRPEWLPPSIPTVYEHAREVSQAFKNIATPQAYLLDPNRMVVTKRVIGSLSDLREMVRGQP